MITVQCTSIVRQRQITRTPLGNGYRVSSLYIKESADVSIRSAVFRRSTLFLQKALKVAIFIKFNEAHYVVLPKYA